MRRIVPAVPPPARSSIAPAGRYVTATMRIAGDRPVLSGHSLIATLRPMLRHQCGKRGLIIPIYTFLPDRLVLVTERVTDDADPAGAIDAFLRDSANWMRSLRCAATWDGDVEWRSVPEEEFRDEVRRVLNLAHVRNFARDPYDYPYTGSVGQDVWRVLGDPEPEIPFMGTGSPRLK